MEGEIKHHKLFEWLIYRRVGNFLIDRMNLNKTRLKSLHFTIMSLILPIIAIPFFLYSTYLSLITAAVILFLGEVFDMMDGELAKRTSSGSIFGSFLDTVGDYISQFLTYGAASIGLFLREENPIFLLFGILTVGLILTINYVNILFNYKLSKKNKGFLLERELELSKNFYIGGYDTFITLLILGSLFNKIEFVLIFISITGPFLIIKQIIRRYKVSKNLDKTS